MLVVKLVPNVNRPLLVERAAQPRSKLGSDCSDAIRASPRLPSPHASPQRVRGTRSGAKRSRLQMRKATTKLTPMTADVPG
jgi:hypothetical protein